MSFSRSWIDRADHITVNKLEWFRNTMICLAIPLLRHLGLNAGGALEIFKICYFHIIYNIGQKFNITSVAMPQDAMPFSQ